MCARQNDKRTLTAAKGTFNSNSTQEMNDQVPKPNNNEFDYLTYEISKAIEAAESLRKRVEQILGFWIAFATVTLGGAAAITTSQSIRYDTITVILGIAAFCIAGVGLVAVLGSIATRAKEAIESLRVDYLRLYMSQRFSFAQNIQSFLGPFNRAPGRFSFEFLLFACFLIGLNTVSLPLGIELAFARIAVVVLPWIFDPSSAEPYIIGHVASLIALVAVFVLQVVHLVRQRRLIRKEKQHLDAVLQLIAQTHSPSRVDKG